MAKLFYGSIGTLGRYMNVYILAKIYTFTYILNAILD